MNDKTESQFFAASHRVAIVKRDQDNAIFVYTHTHTQSSRNDLHQVVSAIGGIKMMIFIGLIFSLRSLRETK